MEHRASMANPERVVHQSVARFACRFIQLEDSRQATPSLGCGHAPSASPCSLCRFRRARSRPVVELFIRRSTCGVSVRKRCGREYEQARLDVEAVVGTPGGTSARPPSSACSAPAAVRYAQQALHRLPQLGTSLPHRTVRVVRLVHRRHVVVPIRKRCTTMRAPPTLHSATAAAPQPAPNARPGCSAKTCS